MYSVRTFIMNCANGHAYGICLPIHSQIMSYTYSYTDLEPSYIFCWQMYLQTGSNLKNYPVLVLLVKFPVSTETEVLSFTNHRGSYSLPPS